MTDFNEILNEVREEDEPIRHLRCDRCGNIGNIKLVDLIEATRYLCATCRMKILEWV